MTTRLSRRTVLRGAGGLTAALPLLDSLRARADEGSAPRRLLIVYTPNGVVTERWFPTVNGSETDFTINDCHRPLEPFKSQLLYVRGMDLAVCNAPVASGGSIGEPHQKGMGALLTGQSLLPGTFIGGDGQAAGWGDGISVDQRIAQHIARAALLRFPSLQLGVRTTASLSEVRNRLSYLGSAQPLPPQDDARAAFDALFTDFHTEPDAMTRVRMQRRSVLDTVLGQLQRVHDRLGRADRARLDQHLTLLRDLEGRVTANPGGGNGCMVPSRPDAMSMDAETTMASMIQSQLDVITAAMACDLTRVASLQISSAINHIRYP